MKDLIYNIIDQAPVHARWINTLSYLEHIGSRKIIKSQNSKTLNLDLLQHIAEEARHAYFLKRVVETHFQGECPTYEEQYLLGGKSADLYFQQLDQLIHREIPNQPVLNYLYVTLTIEQRALALYEQYDQILKEKGMDWKITRLIKEEENHLKETESKLKSFDPDYNERMSDFKYYEDKIFNDFIESVWNDITKETVLNDIIHP